MFTSQEARATKHLQGSKSCDRNHYATSAHVLRASFEKLFSSGWLEARRNRRKHRQRTRYHLWKKFFPRCCEVGCSVCEPWNYQSRHHLDRQGRIRFALSVMEQLEAFAPRLRGTLAEQAFNKECFELWRAMVGQGLWSDPIEIDVVAPSEKAVILALDCLPSAVDREQREGYRVLEIEGLLPFVVWLRQNENAHPPLGATLDLPSLRSISVEIIKYLPV